MCNIQNIENTISFKSKEINYRGYDPFDGLNSYIFKIFPFLKKSRLFKLFWLQLFKLSPINFRYIVGIKKEYNPKGLGLFLSGYCNLYKINNSNEHLKTISFLVSKIKELKSSGYSGTCWGYNFDWQARAFFQPKGTPSVVVTSYVACSLLDVYSITNEKELLDTARSACNFILSDLNKTVDSDGDIAFSYCPLDNTQVFNASLLGARLLCRVYNYTKESILIEEAKKAVSFACKHQNIDGSWSYSPLSFHSWIDNFHTGYNLECIYTYMHISKDYSFEKNFNNGMKYYLSTFFEESGIPKYYNNKRYPIDMHNTAQLIITLSKTGLLKTNKKLIDNVLNWSINNMYDKKKGYFYYSKNKWFANKIAYIRWTQAWMFLALSTYLKEEQK